MIDISHEIFNSVATNLRFLFPGIQVKGEFDPSPAKFPCVTIDEISNVASHLDSSNHNKYADVLYRVQVFSNKENGKRAEARKIYDAVDKKLMDLGFFSKSYTSTPAIYNAEIYSITATFGGTVGQDGMVYRN